MELIKTLKIKSFPWIKDWTYKFSQDTIIKWNWWDWKTSMLKAITWLLAWKDLQWRTIPNITETTSVLSRGSIELFRDHSWLSWSIDRILKWWTDNILSRIIPWYIFSSWLTNKRIAEIITWINPDTYSSWWTTLNKLADRIKEAKKSADVLSKISARVMEFNKAIARDSWVSVLHLLYDYERLFEFNKKRSTITKSIGLIKQTIEEFSSGWWDTSAKYESNKDIVKYLDVLKKTNPAIEYIIDKKRIRDIESLYSFLNRLKQSMNSLQSSISNCMSNLDTLADKWDINVISTENSLYVYLKLLWHVNNLWGLIIKKQTLLKEVYNNINIHLARFWMEFTSSNQLKINAEYEWKTLSLLEMPRHIRFLMEINLCSRLQLDHISNNNSRSSNQAGLILIDDSPLDDDDDTIDSILTEWLSHQVILTKQDKKSKGLEFII